MTYEEALSWLSAAGTGGGNGLEKTRTLLRSLGEPQKKLRFVHVAGTNGKGSTSAMLSAILRAAGYKTGLFTSPYLQRFNERVRIDGRSIPNGALAALATELRSAAEEIGPCPEFALDTALALLYFAREGCDIVVLEVGLGGRLDPTNAIDAPDCAVICNIGLDHTAILGDTAEAIAAEKAGIIKSGCAVALYEPEEDGVLDVVAAVCRERGASLRIADFDELEALSDSLEGQVFCYCDDRPLRLPLLGDHQLKNAAVALEAVEILRERGWRIPDEAVEEGLAAVQWPGRMERVAREPDFLLDGGHNPQCAEALAGNLDYYYEDTRRVLLLGMMADKDADAFLAELAPVGDTFVCSAPEGLRALPAKDLAEKLRGYEKPVFVCDSLAEAVDTARRAAGKDGMVCAAGSLYLVGAIRELLGLEGDSI